MGVWENLQNLPFEAKAGIAVALIVGLVALIQWAISEHRQNQRYRQEQDRLEKQGQAELLAKQADFTFTRGSDRKPIGVGSAGENRILVGTLYSVGMADASLVNVRAFLNGEELRRWGTWARQQDVPVGDRLSIRFLLPFKIEPRDQPEPRRDEALADSEVRIEVRFRDQSAPDRLLTYCFRFDRVENSDRCWSRQVECS